MKCLCMFQRLTTLHYTSNNFHFHIALHSKWTHWVEGKICAQFSSRHEHKERMRGSLFDRVAGLFVVNCNFARTARTHTHSLRYDNICLECVWITTYGHDTNDHFNYTHILRDRKMLHSYPFNLRFRQRFSLSSLVLMHLSESNLWSQWVWPDLSNCNFVHTFDCGNQSIRVSDYYWLKSINFNKLQTHSHSKCTPVINWAAIRNRRDIHNQMVKSNIEESSLSHKSFDTNIDFHHAVHRRARSRSHGKRHHLQFELKIDNQISGRIDAILMFLNHLSNLSFCHLSWGTSSCGRKPYLPFKPANSKQIFSSHRIVHLQF